MSDSVTTGSSSSSTKLSQFGLYRSIDQRAEDFLRLSRKRQIRQGCACAAVSTLITVIIVIVILLIYEYAIAVESSLVQRNGEVFPDSNVTNDTPVADRLDRSYFGFDQDYFEQMPLLVNAMQENSYVDLGVDMTPPPKIDKRGRLPKYRPGIKSHRYTDISSIRRTSPRPFIFEYRSPTPAPFHKKYNSRSWIEGYRNAQRMKNLEQVINYLEKTINAKFGDLYSYPSSTHVAFSGLYLQPTNGDAKVETSPPLADMVSQSSNKILTVTHKNHYSDPLFSFKPESPGDVNLLADAPLKFSPSPTLSVIPMFRPVAKGCVGIRCGTPKNVLNLVQGSAEIKTTNPSLFDKANTFSVIMNLIPMSTTTNTPYANVLTTPTSPDQIYFTTSRPNYQFRRKSTGSINRQRTNFVRRKRPRVIAQKKIGNGVVYDNSRSSKSNSENMAVGGANMILHVKVFPKAEPTTSTTENVPFFTPSMSILNSTQVEDYHDGSSGIIPVDLRSSTTTTTEPPITTTQRYYDSGLSSSEEIRSWSTNPPDIIKFNQEDAKVPEQYQRLREMQNSNRGPYQFETNRRKDSFEANIKTPEPPRTLLVKLKNEIENETTSTTEYDFDDVTSKEDLPTTTFRTYVPQINGHYRSININSRNINNWFNESTEDRKKRLEISTVNGHRTYVPSFEIRRQKNYSNNSNNHKDNNNNDDDDDRE